MDLSAVIAEAVAKAVAEEREGCARLCERYDVDDTFYESLDIEGDDERWHGRSLAAAIRERSETMIAREEMFFTEFEGRIAAIVIDESGSYLTIKNAFPHPVAISVREMLTAMKLRP